MKENYHISQQATANNGCSRRASEGNSCWSFISRVVTVMGSMKAHGGTETEKKRTFVSNHCWNKTVKAMNSCATLPAGKKDGCIILNLKVYSHCNTATNICQHQRTSRPHLNHICLWDINRQRIWNFSLLALPLMSITLGCKKQRSYIKHHPDMWQIFANRIMQDIRWIRKWLQRFTALRSQ
jgi:hypothetical protein